MATGEQRVNSNNEDHSQQQYPYHRNNNSQLGHRQEQQLGQTQDHQYALANQQEQHYIMSMEQYPTFLPQQQQQHTIPQYQLHQMYGIPQNAIPVPIPIYSVTPQSVSNPNHLVFNKEQTFEGPLRQRWKSDSTINSDEPIGAESTNTSKIRKKQKKSKTQRTMKNTVMSVDEFPYSVRKYLANMAILRLYDLIDMINMSAGKMNNKRFWNSMYVEYFSDSSTIQVTKNQEPNARNFFMLVSLLSSLCSVCDSIGLVRLQLVPRKIISQLLSNRTIFFNSERCTLTCHYKDGSYITYFTQIKGSFNIAFKLDWIEIEIFSFVPGIEWNALERLLTNEAISESIFKDLASPSGDLENSPKSMPANFKSVSKLRSYFSVFRNISPFGFHNDLIRVLHINDIMTSLIAVRNFQKVKKIQSPIEAFQKYVDLNKGKFKTSLDNDLRGEDKNTSSSSRKNSKENINDKKDTDIYDKDISPNTELG